MFKQSREVKLARQYVDKLSQNNEICRNSDLNNNNKNNRIVCPNNKLLFVKICDMLN